MFAEASSDWISHTITAVGGAVIAGIGSGLGVYFWARGKASDLKLKENSVDASQRKGAFDELKSLTEFLSSQYKSRSEEVDKRMGSMEAALGLVHRENKELQRQHLECERERIIDRANLDAIRIEVQQLRDSNVLAGALAKNIVGHLKEAAVLAKGDVDIAEILAQDKLRAAASAAHDKLGTDASVARVEVVNEAVERKVALDAKQKKEQQK